MTDKSHNMPNEMPDGAPENDREIETLLRSADRRVVEPNLSALERIRQLSTEEFETAHAEHSGNDLPQVIISPPSSHQTSRESSSMKITGLVSAIAVVLAVGWFATTPSTHASTLKLGDVLSKLDDVGTLQLQVTRDGVAADVWVQDSGIIRWEDSPQRYRIARGSRLWEITEQESKELEVTDTAQNPWVGAEGKIDIVSLLGLELDQGSVLLEATPDGIANYSGLDCIVFRELVDADDLQFRLNFYVNKESKQLIAVTARKKGAKRTGPPLAELALIARNVPMDEGKFRVPVNLAETDRIGTVTDSQGMVALRPVGARRWTPLSGPVLLQVDDWVRTDIRGANAVTVELLSGIKLIVGPGSLLEVTSPDEARLHSGIVQVHRSKSAPNDFVLRGQGSDSVEILNSGKVIYRIDNENKLAVLKKKPVWLSGYDGTSAEDSIGALIVEIDGRNTPLTVGEHHVTIEIRDQIARTTIEETFVNHTNSRLEGQFHFPLPQDASISGFGMWIAGELIEADIVEKQRAREIYETILREKRDPGLLEWTGGNIFKARVFPIEAHSEKRVKIVYTQVLPLQGDRFRYSYALKSEMLQTNPLRELSIRCLINSTVPLSSVESPTHTCRTQLTNHSAELEFVAQEFTPTKDFEVVCDVSQRENDVVVIPHQRGENGYFILELMPPGQSGQWQRQTIADSDPLELILLCDTSGSMDSSMRKSQAEFVVSLLGSLSDEDRVAVATTDVQTDWVIDKFSAASEENIERIRTTLDNRVSLGWTDLDQAIDTVLKKATSKTQVIYIGDGIVATTQNEPAAFVNRVKRRFKNEKNGKRPSFHAVSVGSSYETVVLKGIASLGGGSSRQISGEITPQLAAFNLLNEITSPGLKDVQVEFRGVKVAAVYPEELPNIPAGTQQILVGRYLPTGAEQTGQVIVTGILNGKPVKYVAKIELADAEAGNSFIPRLWARGHLDQLMQQGSNQKIQNQIIALSEEFHIITPYTSLLVLESDADRERFGVKRRFGMRDGEQFFADGRSNANYELKQQQMQKAGSWRLGLRRKILGEFADLERNAKAFQRFENVTKKRQFSESERLGTTVYPVGDLMLGITPSIIIQDEEEQLILRDHVQFMPTAPHAAEEFSFYVSLGREANRQTGQKVDMYFDRSRGRGVTNAPNQTWGLDYNFTGLDAKLGERKLGFSSFDSNGSGYDRQSPFLGNNLPLDGYSRESVRFDSDSTLVKEASRRIVDFELPSLQQQFGGRSAMETIGLREFSGEERRSELFGKDGEIYAGTRLSAGFQQAGGGGFGRNRQQGNSPSDSGLYWGDQLYRGRRSTRSSSLNWVRQLFPPIPVAITETKEEPNESKWSAEAIELSKSLLVRDDLKQLAGGIEISRTAQTWDDDFDRLVPSSRRTEVWSPTRWLTLDHSQGQNAIINWRDQKQVGVNSESYLLGQVRDVAKDETNPLPLRVPGYTLSPLHESFHRFEATIEKIDDGRSQLKLTSPDNDFAIHILIDTKRNVITKRESLNNGKVTSTSTFQDFVEAAGRWWATKIVTTNAERPNEPRHLISQTVRELSEKDFETAWGKQLNKRDDALVLSLPLPKVREARRAVQNGDAKFADHFVMLLHYGSTQKWEEVFEHLRELESHADGKSGMQWIRIAIELTAGRKEDARQRLVKFMNAWSDGTATNVPASQRGDLFLATHVLTSVYPIIGWPEYSPLVDKAKPIFERQADADVATLAWQHRWLGVLGALKKSEEAFALQKKMADDNPGNVSLQIAHANRWSSTDRDAALAFLHDQMSLENHWRHNELTQLRRRKAEMLESWSRYKELLTYLKDWLSVETKETSVFGRYLTAMVMNDHIGQCEQTATDWLKIALQQRDLDAVQQAKIRAASRFALGNGHKLRRYYGMDRKWLPELYATAIACFENADRLSLAKEIVNDSNFSQSDKGDRLRSDMLNWLLADAGDLPFERLQLYISLLRQGRLLTGDGDDMEIRQVRASEWTTIVDKILKRWETTEKPSVQNQLSAQLSLIYSEKLRERHLPFLRRLVAEGPKDYLPSYRINLFNTLQSQSWTEEVEAEAFTLWSTLTQAELAPQRVVTLVPQLYPLIDKMLANRISAAQTKLQDEGKTDELTRTELAEKQAEILLNARIGLAKRLVSTAESIAATHPEMIPWLQLERIRIDVQLDRKRNQLFNECWSLVGETPPVVNLDAERTLEEVATESQQVLIRERAFHIIINLAARKNAPEQHVEKVLKYVDASIANSEETSRKLQEKLKEEGREEEIDFSRSWKLLKYKLLILFDRPDELTMQLKEWIRTEKWNTTWQRSLALLAAERGDIEAAIEVFKAIQKKGELSAADFTILADWYLVMDQREKHDASHVAAMQNQNENNIANYLNQKSNNIRSAGGPHELDEQTFIALKALFAKTTQPERHYSTLRNLYTATRDFRVLEAVPETMLGRTRSKAYNALRQFRSSILNEVRKEATADKLLEHIYDLRARMQAGEVPRGADPNKRSLVLDLRALDLIEAMIEFKSAEVLNQPGPHAKKAITALRRAFDRDWENGEQLDYARFLQSLGGITNSKNKTVLQPLADLQLKQLQELYEGAEIGSADRCRFAIARAELLFPVYNRKVEAVELMEVALNEVAQKHGGLIPYSLNGFVSSYSSLLQKTGAYAKAEAYILKHRNALQNENQKWTYENQLNHLYEQALRKHARVSLGEKNTLFVNFIDRLIKLAATRDVNRRYQLVNRIGNTFDFSMRDRLCDEASAKKRLWQFAQKTFPELMQPINNRHTGSVNQLSRILSSRLSPVDALEFLLDQYESYPAKLRYGSQDPWAQHGWQLAQYRHEGAIGRKGNSRVKQLEVRLLLIALGELRKELVNQTSRNAACYHDDYSYFWKEKAGDFNRVAEDVLRERQESPRTIFYVAKYLYQGLSRHSRAIDILMNSRKRGLLDDSGKRTLVQYLHEQSMYQKSIPILSELVELHPHEMSLRVLLVRALHHTNQKQKVEALIAATDEHFHTKNGAWGESNIIQFARICVEVGRLKRGIGYFEEAINLHQRNARNRGIGDGTLSQYYYELAQAYSQVKNTEKAVDAAAAAIVSWGPRHDQRTNAVSQMQSVVNSAPDIDAYVKSLDQKAKKLGTDSPIIRKSIGNRFYNNQKYERALKQYELALELSPYDRELHVGLLNCYDKLNNPAGAVQQLLAQIDFDRHNLSLYTDLAQRAKEDPALAERAATSIVESAPNEAESHQALAKFREGQQRWNESIDHWQRVSELRKLEPTGLLGLANAQVHAKRWDDARQSIRQLRRQEWPSRFRDVEDQTREIENGIKK